MYRTKSWTTVLPKLVTVCPYIAIYKTDTFVLQSQGGRTAQMAGWYGAWEKTGGYLYFPNPDARLFAHTTLTLFFGPIPARAILDNLVVFSPDDPSVAFVVSISHLPHSTD